MVELTYMYDMRWNYVLPIMAILTDNDVCYFCALYDCDVSSTRR